MTTSPHHHIAPGVVLEDLGREMLVVVPGRSEIIRLSGPSAKTVRALQQGFQPNTDDTSLRELRDLGITGSTSGFSRRSLLRAGVLGVGAGITVAAMPSLALASSSEAPLFGSWAVFDSNIEFTFEWTSNPRPSDDLNDGGPKPSPISSEAFAASVGNPSTEGSTTAWLGAISIVFGSSSFVPSGAYTGTFTFDGATYEVTFNETA